MAAGGFWSRVFGRPAPEAAPAPRLVLPRVPTSDDLLEAVSRVEQLVATSAVPAVVASRVGRVCRVVRETVPRLATLGAGSPQAYNVMATATDYLPDAVGGYLRLPREFADSRPVDRGKTSLMILIDQLDLLGSTMDKVYDAVCRADAEALVVQGRFLAERFGPASGGGALDLGQLAQGHPGGLEPPPPPAPPSPHQAPASDAPPSHPSSQPSQ